MRRRVRRKLDWPRTFRAYTHRINDFSDEELEELDDKYLTSFDVWNTFDTRHNPPPHTTSNAFVLAEIAKSRGVKVRGVTSERRINDRLICESLLNGDVRSAMPGKFVYTGPFNYFTGHKSSKWSILPEDKRYVSINRTGTK